MTGTDIVKINDGEGQKAKKIAALMSEPDIRKKGMLDMIGVQCAVKYLNSKKIMADTKRSIHKIPQLYEEFNIVDIYYGNYRIDVITLYNEKEIKIPKLHSEYDILPNFYLIIQLGAKIQDAKITGFIKAQDVLNCICDSKYYYPPLNMVFNTNEFIAQTRQQIPSRAPIGMHTECMGLFLKFVDKDLSTAYKKQFIQHVLNCDSCRRTFENFVKFESMARNISKYPELMSKYSLVEHNNIQTQINQNAMFEQQTQENVQNVGQYKPQMPPPVANRAVCAIICTDNGLGGCGNVINSCARREFIPFSPLS